MLLQASINAFICYLLNVMDGTAGYETFATAKVQQKIDIRKYMPIFFISSSLRCFLYPPQAEDNIYSFSFGVSLFGSSVFPNNHFKLVKFLVS